MPLSGHSAFERTYNRVKSRFYFDNMRQRILDYCKGCQDCQIMRRPHGFKLGQMTIPKQVEICEKWFLDFLGPFPISDNGNRYVIVAMESFSRYVMAEATPDSTTETILSFLNKLISSFGCFKYLVTDNAKAFHSSALKDFSKAHGYKKLFYNTIPSTE